MNFSTNKAHGHDLLGIRMIKLQKLICKPLLVIFISCLNGRKYPSDSKKGNIEPVRMKQDKQFTKSYRNHMRLFSVFIVNFEHISHLALVFLWFTLNM